MMHAVESPSGLEPKGKARIPRWVVVLMLALLVPVLAFGAAWVNYKKPWLMDDFRAGYAAGKEGDLPGDAKDPCGDEMANRYGGAESYAQYDTPEDQSAFYIGCSRGLNGLSNDWWNVSGYLTA